MPVTAAAREAILLPLIFLTVALLGGLRISDTLDFRPPALYTVVLALLMAGALVRSGTLAPERLYGPVRSTLANTNGIVVFATVFFASAQVFNLVTPDTGLPRLLFYVLFTSLLLYTLAASATRAPLLRSLLVVFGSAFVLKFVVLAAMSRPTEGLGQGLRRVALEVVTFGSVLQPSYHPATGYIAFLTLALFLFGVTLLPSAVRDDSGRGVSQAKG